MMRKGAFLLLAMCLFGGTVTGCSDNDPSYDDVTPPVVEVLPNTLTGMITAISGEAISGATVTLGTVTAATDAEGVYHFDDVKAGAYTIKAEAEGKQPKQAEIIVEDLQETLHLTWNAVLANDAKVEVVASATEDTEGSVETEALEDNELAVVDVVATIPAAAVEVSEDNEEEEVEIVVSPIYHTDDVNIGNRAVSRADEGLLMIGASLSASKSGVTLKKPIELGFNVDEEFAQSVEARQYVDGEWMSVNSRVENGRVIVDAMEFTAYGLFLDVTFSSSNASEPVEFVQSEWNNLYGAKEMLAGNATYTYKVGTEITSKGTNVLTALLIEKLAQQYGATLTIADGTYPLNVTLPVGTALTITGVQQKQQVSVSAMGRSVQGTNYGTVTVIATTYNRQHTGGSNIN